MPVFPAFLNADAGPLIAFHAEATARIRERLSANPRLAEVVPASRLEVRPVPEMVSSGIGEIDELTGGFPRGCLTEICGGASSGRTSVLLATLAAATQRQEACALVDVNDAFDPASAASAGVHFERLLWVRCGIKQTAAERRKSTAHGASRESAVEQALRVTDLLLQSGGFGLVIIDLGDIPIKTARRIPLTSWFRFQRAVERTPTVLFVISQAPCTQSCAVLLLKVHAESASKKSVASAPATPSHTQLLDGLHIQGELLRSRTQRKPAQSVTAAFATTRVG
jgi:recA bacterial DNA recombination protein